MIRRFCCRNFRIYSTGNQNNKTISAHRYWTSRRRWSRGFKMRCRICWTRRLRNRGRLIWTRRRWRKRKTRVCKSRFWSLLMKRTWRRRRWGVLNYKDSKAWRNKSKRSFNAICVKEWELLWHAASSKGWTKQTQCLKQDMTSAQTYRTYWSADRRTNQRITKHSCFISSCQLLKPMAERVRSSNLL